MRKEIEGPGAQATPPLEHLAPREQQVLDLLAKGRAYKQIAAEMDLHIGTVRTYIRRIYDKLHVNCRTDAVVRYLDATPAKASLSPRARRYPDASSTGHYVE